MVRLVISVASFLSHFLVQSLSKVSFVPIVLGSIMPCPSNRVCDDIFEVLPLCVQEAWEYQHWPQYPLVPHTVVYHITTTATTHANIAPGSKLACKSRVIPHCVHSLDNSWTRLVESWSALASKHWTIVWSEVEWDWRRLSRTGGEGQ